MGKTQNIDHDLEVFIEYQQVVKEPDVTKVKQAKDQVFEIYKNLMNSKEGKSLITDHHKFKTSAINLKSERSFLANRLKQTIKENSTHIALRRNDPVNREFQAEQVKQDASDLAASLTSNKLHPYLQQNPEKQKHALGVLARVAGIRQEKSINLANELSNTKSKIENMIGNLLKKGTPEKEITSLMDIAPEPTKTVEFSQEHSKSQAVER